MNIQPFTNDKWGTLPHIAMTSNVVWDASVFDCKLSDGDGWQNFFYNKLHGYLDTAFDVTNIAPLTHQIP
jgi:hypothetical protein